MQFFRDYFTIPKSNKIELFIIVIIILLIAGSNFFIPNLIVKTKADFSKYEKAINNLKNNPDVKTNYKSDSAYYEDGFDVGNFKVFIFDPNTATYNQFIELGLKKYVAERIVKYRNKGGKFKKKEDLKKIFGFDVDLYNTLEPFIKINDQKPEVISYENKIPDQTLVIDLNKCEKLELIQLKGIGEKRAEMIIKYRNLLGGFINRDQLLEVYGIDSSTYLLFKDNVQVTSQGKIKQVSLNLGEKTDFGYHPYIGFALSAKIIEYRNKNGPFESIEALYAKNIITDRKIFEKIAPYLVLWE